MKILFSSTETKKSVGTTGQWNDPTDKNLLKGTINEDTLLA